MRTPIGSITLNSKPPNNLGPLGTWTRVGMTPVVGKWGVSGLQNQSRESLLSGSTTVLTSRIDKNKSVDKFKDTHIKKKQESTTLGE